MSAPIGPTGQTVTVTVEVVQYDTSGRLLWSNTYRYEAPETVGLADVRQQLGDAGFVEQEAN